MRFYRFFSSKDKLRLALFLHGAIHLYDWQHDDILAIYWIMNYSNTMPLTTELYIIYIDDNVPRLHDINTILDRFKEKLPEQLSEERANLFDTLSQFYLQSRYPDYTSALASLTTQETAQSIYEKSEEAFQWLLTMKPQGE
jgi:AcrR family transcriptional regulator